LVPRIRKKYHLVLRIRENRVPKIRGIGSLQVHTGYLTFSLKKTVEAVKKNFFITAYVYISKTFKLTNLWIFRLLWSFWFYCQPIRFYSVHGNKQSYFRFPERFTMYL